VIDVSIPVHNKMPFWPGGKGVRLSQLRKIGPKSLYNNCHLSCDVHTGTHIDAPKHFVKHGITIDQLDIDTLVGPCQVISLEDCDKITAVDLKRSKIRKETTRLIVKTSNSKLWKNPLNSFNKNFVAFTRDAAEWLVSKKIALLGIDYLSVQRFYDGPQVHQILLRSNIVLVEGLDLSKVGPGIYNLVCLPIKLQGSDGAPARVILSRRKLCR